MPPAPACNAPADAEALASLRAQCRLYALLASACGPPGEAMRQAVAQCDPSQPGQDDSLASPLEALLAAARQTSAQELASGHMALFDPVGGPFPYETEWQELEDFAKAQVLADIMGFYRAFGVEPRGDRPDHLAAELEFVHYLLVKELRAIEAGTEENAAVCRDARQSFLREHLLTWPGRLIEALRAQHQAPSPFYARLLDLLDAFLRVEKETLP